MSGVVIVGGGQAGAQVAFSLRDLGYPDSVTIVSDEDRSPYQRPPLSKGYLADDADPAALEFRDPDFYEHADIRLVLGEAVTAVTLEGDAGRVGTSSGRELPFDRLVIATGVQARRLDLDGADAAGVLSLRDVADADALRTELRRLEVTGGNVVLAGAGFIGLEIAAACRKRGLDVTVVEMAPRVLPRGIDETMSQAVAAAHGRRGIRLVLGAGVAHIRTVAGRVSSVVTSDGRDLPCDLLIVGIGAVPRVAVAELAGVPVADGIVVDQFCRTAVPRVLAAGDCATMTFPWSAKPIRLESVANAVEHGRIAAGSIMGCETAYAMPPWFWSDQGDVRLQMAGWTTGADDLVVRGDEASEKFSVLHYREGHLVGIEAMNSPSDFNAVRKALAASLSIDPDRARDAHSPLRDAIAPVAT